MPTSGTDLKVKRVRARVKLNDLADAMGLSRQTLWVIENAGQVDPERVTQYLAAVETCRNIKAEGAA